MKVITIGRDTTNNIVINDAKVSRVHCQIVQKDEGVCSIVDLGSTNGTFVNGRRISGETQLQSKDVVRIGGTNLPWRNYVEPMAKAAPALVVADVTPNKKRRIWYVVTCVVSIVLIVGGIGLWFHLGNHEEKMPVGPALLKRDAEIKLLQLQAEADSLRREAYITHSTEERERLISEAQQKQNEANKIQERLEKMIEYQTDTIDHQRETIKNIEEYNSKLVEANATLAQSQKILATENETLQNNTKEYEARNEELNKQVSELTKKDELTKRFWNLLNSLDIRNDKQTIKDVYDQLQNKGFTDSKSKDKDYIAEAFNETKDNDSKQYIIDVIKYTKDFNNRKIDSQIADRVIEQMRWTQQEGVMSTDLVKSQFMKMNPEGKENILNIIASVSKEQKDKATNAAGGDADAVNTDATTQTAPAAEQAAKSNDTKDND